MTALPRRTVRPRRAALTLVMLGGLTLGLTNITGAVAEPALPGDGVYRLTNTCGGLALDVRRAGLQNGAAALVWPYAAAANQQWQLTEVSAGRYRLTALHSGKLLDVSNAGQQGTPVIQWSGTGGTNQEWLIRAAGGGHHQVTPAHAPALRLEVSGSAKEVGAPVRVGTARDGCAQRWKLEAVAVPARTSRLGVSPDGRALVHSDGSPFLYLGDTAWELAHRLNRQEVIRYLDTRRAQGFTVIQMVALAELDGISVVNAQGDLPLRDKDPARPATTPGAGPNNAAEYDYWDHLDYVIEQAASRGMTVALLPTWGQWVNNEPLFKAASARQYGEFLGERYRGWPVIWMLGGDRAPETEAQRAIWRAMAAGIETGAGSREAALISYHPDVPHTSAQWFHNEAWLDFNTWQTGHCRGRREWEKVAQVGAMKPTKPVLNAEPIYEDIPVCFDPGKLGYSDATDVRNAAYWSVFAGAFGHTYGHHSVWQMWQEGRQKVHAPRTSWQDALRAPGAEQMRHLRTLLEARPLLGRTPDPELVVESHDGQERIQAIRGNGYALVYTAAGREVRVRGGRLPGNRTVASWYNPRTGQTQPIRTVTREGEPSFKPPSQGRGHDWVLILDDAARGYPAPGRS